MAALFCFRFEADVTGVAPTFFIAAALSSPTYSAIKPRFLSAAIKAATALSIFLRLSSPYFSVSAEKFVTITLSILVGIVSPLISMRLQRIIDRADSREVGSLHFLSASGG